MKHETLLQETPPGSDAEFQLAGNASARGRVVEIAHDLLVLDDGQQQRKIFMESIVGFSPLSGTGAKASTGDKGAPATEDPSSAEASLQKRDEIEAELQTPGRVGVAVRLAEQFAAEVKGRPEPARSDGNLRYAVVQAFKLLEYHRKLAAADLRRHAEAVQLTRGLLALNEALRAAERVTDEDRFSDLYHFLVAFRLHASDLKGEAALRENLRRELEQGWKLGNELLEDAGVAQAWERQPFRRKTHYHRLSEIAKHRVQLGFVVKAEADVLREKAERFALLGDRSSKSPRSATPAMGRIASFGSGKFGFIQTRELRTLYFTLRDVVSAETQALLNGGGSEVEVDFDVVPAEPGKKYDRAVRVREPGSSAGAIARLFAARNFGYIELYDGRSVHFWLQALPDPDVVPVEGTPVICWAVKSPKGWTTDRIVVYASQPGDRPYNPASSILKTAQEARNAGNIQVAIRILEDGLRECPDPQMILMLAAITKEIDPDRVTAVYERGLRDYDFSNDYKLHEDYGVWLARLRRYEEAVRILRRALDLTRADSERRGLKGVLLALGRTLFFWRTPDSIREAEACYREAAELWGGEGEMRARLPLHDVQCLDGVRADFDRLDPQGGDSFEFLAAAGLPVEKKRFDAAYDATDMACAVDSLVAADFALGERIFLRYLPVKTAEEVNTGAMEKAVASAVEDWETGDTVALLLLDEVPDALASRLHGRVMPTRDAKRPLVIVPLSRMRLEHHRDPRQMLREALGVYLGKRDLFLRKGKVTGSEFFGRTAIVAEINSRLLRNELIGLFGLRRTGKTSVLERIRQSQQAEGNIVLFQDLLPLKGKRDPLDWACFEFAQQLRAQCERRPGVVPELSGWDLAGNFDSVIQAQKYVRVADAFFSDLQRFLQRLETLPQHGRPRVILIADEIEQLKTAPPQSVYGETALAFLSSLRGFYQNHEETFSVILTAANPSVAEQGRFQGVDNPVFNCIETIYLGFFEESECREMIVGLGRGMGLTFEEAAIRRVYQATAGHPFLARYLCSLAAQRRSAARSISDSIIRDAEHDFLSSGGEGDKAINEILERIRDDYPAEMTLLREIAAPEARPSGNARPTDSQGRTAIRHLLDYGLVEQQNGRLSIRADLVRRTLTGELAPPPDRARAVGPDHGPARHGQRVPHAVRNPGSHPPPHP